MKLVNWNDLLIKYEFQGDTAVNGEDKVGDLSGASRSSKEVIKIDWLIDWLIFIKYLLLFEIGFSYQRFIHQWEVKQKGERQR